MPHPYAAVFDEIYRTDAWGHGSGVGSLPLATGPYRAFLQAFLRDNHVRSVVDLGCGDMQTSARLDWTGVDYLGVDASPDMVRRNKLRFRARGLHFATFTSYDALPPADVLLAKDVLQHLPNADVHAVLGLRRYRFLLLTNCVAGEGANEDIAPGGFRPLRLADPPFSGRGLTVLRYAAPVLGCLWPRPDLARLARHLGGRPAWVKEVFAVTNP